MDRIVASCPLTKFEGGLMTLHDAEDDTVNWAKFCGNYRTREITSLVPRLTTWRWPRPQLGRLQISIDVWRQLCRRRPGCGTAAAAAVDVRNWRTNGRTDTQPLHRSCTAYYATNVRNYATPLKVLSIHSSYRRTEGAEWRCWRWCVAVTRSSAAHLEEPGTCCRRLGEAPVVVPESTRDLL